MKIYEIGTGYTPIPAQVAAATESVVEELTKAFISQKQDVEILDISAVERAPHNLPITEIKVPSVFAKSDVSLGIVHKLKRVIYSLALSLKLKKILKSSEQKVILHFHNQYNIFFFLKTVPSKIRKKAVIAYTNHNGVWNMSWDEAESTLKKRYFQEIEGMKKADFIFVLNEKTKENIEKHLGISGDKIFKINNGVNTNIYFPLPKEDIDKIKEKYNFTGKKIILQVGSVYENKGQVRSIEMLSPLLKGDKNLVYAFVGEIVSQEYFEQVKNIAREAGVENQIAYLGAVSPGNEMNEIYNMADTTVFVSQYESFGLVCIEAFAAGVPVIICSDLGVDFGDGCIRCKKSEFIEKMSETLEDNIELSRLARNNAENNYSWDIIAQGYSDIILK